MGLLSKQRALRQMMTRNMYIKYCCGMMEYSNPYCPSSIHSPTPSIWNLQYLNFPSFYLKSALSNLNSLSLTALAPLAAFSRCAVWCFYIKIFIFKTSPPMINRFCESLRSKCWEQHYESCPYTLHEFHTFVYF